MGHFSADTNTSELLAAVKENAAEAVYENGVLKITMPKAKAKAGSKVKVKVKKEAGKTAKKTGKKRKK